MGAKGEEKAECLLVKCEEKNIMVWCLERGFMQKKSGFLTGYPSYSANMVISGGF